jgi:signal transduction histidine kinase
MRDWASVPFHFIWVSLTVLFGFRLWSDRMTWALVSLVVVSTGIILVQLWLFDGMPTDEVLEVPLMFGMFLAMLLHTTRRRAAIAELRTVSEQNAQLVERQRSFIRNASHELRTPITVALAQAELLQLDARSRSEHDDVDIVVDELGRLRRLTDRLLLLAAVDVPELMRPVLTDLAELVTATARRWAPTSRDWRLGRLDKAIVLGDPERLMVALDTVLENAIKVTEDGDPIELSVRVADGIALIEVSDSGTGIDPDLLGSLFDRFTTAGRQPGAPAGFGLGLAIVDAIIRAHGGNVTARNRRERGAVFTFRLPLASARSTPAPGRSATEATDVVETAPTADLAPLA